MAAYRENPANKFLQKIDFLLLLEGALTTRVVNFPEISGKPESYNVYNFHSNSLIFLEAMLNKSHFF